MRKAVYAGSFDPVTNGHLWMIERGVAMFDELVVAIGINPEKRYTFSIAEREAMLRETILHHKNIQVEVFENQFLVNYAKTIGARFILRGVRSAADYEFERTMRYVNGDLHPEITTVFLMPPREIAEVSSTMVKGMVGPIGWRDVVQRYVAPPVFNRLLDWERGRADD